MSAVVPPRGRVDLSDGHTAIVQAGARGSSNEMVRAADRLKEPLAQALRQRAWTCTSRAPSGMWSDFNAANRSAMLKSEVISWPVTLGIMLARVRLARRCRAAAHAHDRRPAGAAGSLYLGTKIMPISIWAMNFALMFALALGIDYALFIVHRFRGAFFGSKIVRPGGDRRHDGHRRQGRAVLGVTVLISLSAVMLVPSPAFRSMSLGIMLSVVFVLAATLTLLPAVLAKLGPKVDNLSLPWVKHDDSPALHRRARFAAWGERLWRRPLRLRRDRPGRCCSCSPFPSRS